MSKKGIKCYFDDSVLSPNEMEFFWEHHFDINALWQENNERISDIEAARCSAAKTNSILEQKIKELEAENADLKNRADASGHNGAAPQESSAAGTDALKNENAALAEEIRKLSESKKILQEKVLGLTKENQNLQQKLSQNGGNRMSEEITQWEYKTVSEATKDYKRDSVATDKKLNEMGNEGWEVAGIMNFSGTSSSFLMKRPKKTQDSDYGYSR